MSERTKVIVYAENNTVYDADGNYIGVFQKVETYEEPNSASDITLALVKHGVTVDEIIKLKNADLI